MFKLVRGVFLGAIFLLLFLPGLFKVLFSLSIFLLVIPVGVVTFTILLGLVNKKNPPNSQPRQYDRQDPNNNDPSHTTSNKGTIIDSKDYKILDDD